jgi:hypothetical protein
MGLLLAAYSIAMILNCVTQLYIQHFADSEQSIQERDATDV